MQALVLTRWGGNQPQTRKHFFDIELRQTKADIITDLAPIALVTDNKGLLIEETVRDDCLHRIDSLSNLRSEHAQRCHSSLK